MNLEDVKKIVEAGIIGPSPFNIQAVRYEYIESTETLNVCLDSDRAFMKPLTSEHTFKEHCIGAGACVENIVLCAEKLGYKANVTYAPDKSDRFLLAKINFDNCTPSESPLYSFIPKSWSNRCKMIDKEIPVTELEAIQKIADEYKDYFRLELVTEKEQRLEIAKLSAKAETMNWSLKATQSKHRSFLKFSNKEMEEKRDGICVWDFGIPEFLAPIMKPFTQWSVYRFFVPLGIAHYVGWTSRMRKGKTVKSFFIFIIKEKEDVKRWLIGGEMIQKILLYSTMKGIDHQWFSSIYIWDDVANGLGDINCLSDSYKKKALEYSDVLRKILPIAKNEYVLASLALGYVDRPMTKKYRRTVEDVLFVKK